MNLLYLICITHLAVVSQPAIYLKRILGFKSELFDSFHPFKKIVHTLLHCHLCLGFWIGMIYFKGDFMQAAAVSCGAELLNRIYNKLI